jgi:hypothetical protein
MTTLDLSKKKNHYVTIDILCSLNAVAVWLERLVDYHRYRSAV